jgi:xanthine dioxygenase
LHPDLKTIPRQPQVQLIGNGTVYNHEGLTEAALKHPSHTTFHKTRVSDEDEAKGITRFYRWHQDAALYELAPPKVTALYGISVPQGPHQTCRYDDETGDELSVPLGTTAFVSGTTMFEILPSELKSLAVRSKVKFAPHCFVWMAPAKAHSTGLKLETEGLELPWSELPPWEESKIVILPVVSALNVMSFSRFLIIFSYGKIPLPTICIYKLLHVVRRNSLLTPFHTAQNVKEPCTRTVHISQT